MLCSRIVFLVLIALCWQTATATIIHVPDEQSTIQAGIDAAVDGDTVLVQPGIYLENINFDGHNILLGSLFITTGDTSYISQTAIDGSQDNSSTVNFENGEISAAILCGFTITDGSVGVRCASSDATLRNLIITNSGAGISCGDANTSISHVTIHGNYRGIICSSTNLELTNAHIYDNHTAYLGGGISLIGSTADLSDVNISGNSAGNGGGIGIDNYSSLTFTNGIISNNTSTSEGGGFWCEWSDLNLTDVTLSNNLSLSFGGGMYISRGNLSIENSLINQNSALTGGGIFISGDLMHLENVIIVGNSAGPTEVVGSGFGGGIRSNSTVAELSHVYIAGNSATHRGGGIDLGTNYTFSDVTITNNIAGDAGGGINVRSAELTFSSTSRSSIYSNRIANDRGFGVDMYCVPPSFYEVFLDTFSVDIPTDYYAAPIDSFQFDILHHLGEELIESDLYVAEGGDDENEGTSPERPLKTINHALSRIAAGHTIHLADGVYSPTTTGECFPIRWSNHTNLSGSGASTTIVDAETSATVMEFWYLTESLIEDITITRGDEGVYCYHASPTLQQLIVSNNDGGGIVCTRSDLHLSQVDVAGNHQYGIRCSYANLGLERCIVWSNSPQAVQLVASSPNSITISCSDIEGGEAGIETNYNDTVYWLENNIDEDPLFCFPFRDCRLQLDSPCRTHVCGFMGYTGETCEGEVVGAAPRGCPAEFYLAEAYPNPFNPSTTIEYGLATVGLVKLSVYNINGQLVDVIQNEFMHAGQHSVEWLPVDLPSGVYFLELQAGEQRDVQKMSFVK